MSTNQGISNDRSVCQNSDKISTHDHEFAVFLSKMVAIGRALARELFTASFRDRFEQLKHESLRTSKLVYSFVAVLLFTISVYFAVEVHETANDNSS